MEIFHPWHPHRLFLSDEAEFEDDCSICRKGLDGNPFYACVDCKYFVHKSCAQLPVKIQHHFHPPHPLALRFGGFACDSCHKRFRNELRFRCKMCNFDLDVKCALMTDIDADGKEFITHFTHQHPLTICSKDGDNLLNCFACKKTSSDLIYGCTPCDYFLHKSCAQISTHVLHAMHPEHALSLVVKFGSCEYCRIYNHTWKFYCNICDFFLDVSCLIESVKDAQNSERSCFLCGKQHLDSDSCVNSLYFINQSCIQLPEAIKQDFHSHKPLLLLGIEDFECDSCHKWFDRRSHYGCEECNFRMDVKCALMTIIQYEESDESICPIIPHHFKHQHPLQLISEVNDINCSACPTTKLSPIYGCVKCEYFLHQSCLELPIQIEHPLHSHLLTIQPRRYNFCQICHIRFIGFSFGCIQCSFFIGIECILELGPTVGHKYHSTLEYKYHCHLLYLIEKSYCDQCNADDTFCQFSEESSEFKRTSQISKESSEFKLTKSYSLQCMECDYNLHLLCGPLPCTIKHKSHLHALKLVDYIVEDHSDEHYCDICEEIRNPRLCIYYCEDCKFFAHVYCVLSEIINVFKKNPQKIELRIVGDLRLEDTINPLHINLTEELLKDLLKRLDANDVSKLSRYFPHGELFPREEEEEEDDDDEEEEEEDEDERERPLQNSSCEDDTINLIEELSFYNDDIFLKIRERLKLFKPYTKYHIQPDECELPVIEVEGYKVTSNFAPLFRILWMKYGDFGHNSTYSKNLKSVLLYFLYRVLKSMHRTFVVDITEKQLFTWLYYIRGIRRCGFDLEFVNPLLHRIMRSYFGLRAMKFEDEATIGRYDCEIVEIEKKISELKNKIEELKCKRQQHRVGMIAQESAIMREKFFTVAKELKWCKASGDIFTAFQ